MCTYELNVRIKLCSRRPKNLFQGVSKSFKIALKANKIKELLFHTVSGSILMKLTTKQCQTAKSKSKPYKLTDGGGLILHIFPNGGKYWRLRYRVAGKEKLFSIGVYSKYLGLTEARKERDLLKMQIKDGIDPSMEKQNDKAQRLEESKITFEFVALEWIAKKSNEWSENHTEDVRRSLEIHINPA